jgi:putative transposase
VFRLRVVGWFWCRERLLEKGIRVGTDGKSRALDNVFIEWLWHSIKYEEVYPNC